MKRKHLTMKKADIIFSNEIRERDNWACVLCGRSKAQGYRTENSHYWGRGNKTTRYDPENCDTFCSRCHMEHEGSKQGLYTDWKKKQLGEERYEALRKRAMSIGKLFDILVEFQIARGMM